MDSSHTPDRSGFDTSRRALLKGAAAATAISSLGRLALAQARVDHPAEPAGVAILPPRNRKVVSQIIDDSTALVNLAYFGIPQFHHAFPDRYPQDWRSMPREIPDDFVRKFADFTEAHGIKGKYSMVPYPACVGWLDRDLPGWSNTDLKNSLKLVRERLTPNWDIHPEMISHTWAIDIRTGRPFEDRSSDHMENWGFSQKLSADEMASYMVYALRILRNVDLPCEGITTPGGFGNQNLENLSLGTFQAVRDVFGARVPHYFRHLFTDDQSVAPRVERGGAATADDMKAVVSIIGCTGDWFGGWDGLEAGDADRFITPDLASGRMVDVIARGEPAVMVCHWPGLYFNGAEHGFNVLKTVVDRLERRYPDGLHWMKLSEIARYAAARHATAGWKSDRELRFDGVPAATARFTVAIDTPAGLRFERVVHRAGAVERELKAATDAKSLDAPMYLREAGRVVVCFDLAEGENAILLR